MENKIVISVEESVFQQLTSSVSLPALVSSTTSTYQDFSDDEDHTNNELEMNNFSQGTNGSKLNITVIVTG